MFYVWLASVVLAVIIANSRGHNGWLGFLWGVLFGPIAVIAYLVIPRNQEALDNAKVIAGVMRHCPECREVIKRHANRCRFCGASMTGD